MFKVTILVHYVESVVNPDEEVLKNILSQKNIPEVKQIKMGRTYLLDVQASDRAEAEKIAKNLADNILVNPAMETYSITVEEA